MADKEQFADLEQMKVDILKEKILSGLQEFKDNPKQQWTALRFEKPLLEKLLSSIEQAERVEELGYLLEHRTKMLKYSKDRNRRYKQALEFYAVSGQGIGEAKHGEVARQALEETE